jgi:hypothetical protein
MDLGFETIGNATLLCHDGAPVLATDPWITGSAYFGSWTRSHAVPEEQRRSIGACPYVWLSHGHPDHLSLESLELLRAATLLVPDHVGGRIRRDLMDQGFRVRVLPDRTWVQLSARIRVACVADWNQDAVLLVDIDGRLVVDLNDAGERGWGSFVRAEIRRHPESYMMRLSGYGDADMINLFDDAGRRVLPEAAARVPVGQAISRMVDGYGVRFFIPFSSMHRYQRADSVWANAYTTGLEDYANGFASRRCELLPAFVRVDLLRDEVQPIHPPEEPVRVVDSREHGDDWEEPLDRSEEELLAGYVRAIEHVRRHFGFVAFRVGGRDTRIALEGPHGTGLTFEVPRASLMTAVRYRVFDDLLIGNFMKTTLHGAASLYPDFSPFVAKYADNGEARTREELEDYFRAYRTRDAVGYLRDQLEARCVRPIQMNAARFMRRALGGDSAVFRAAKEAYYGVRRVVG